MENQINGTTAYVTVSSGGTNLTTANWTYSCYPVSWMIQTERSGLPPGSKSDWRRGIWR